VAAKHGLKGWTEKSCCGLVYKFKSSKVKIEEADKVHYSFFEGARWANDIKLECKPNSSERALWIPFMYRLLQDGDAETTLKRITRTVWLGAYGLLAVEAYGFWTAYNSIPKGVREALLNPNG
jgi:hypothetical protein